MLAAIFYLFGVYFIWHELIWIISPSFKAKEARKFFEAHKEHVGKKWGDLPESYREIILSHLGVIFITLWMFFGLFSSQWIGFLFMLVLNLFIVAPISKLVRDTWIYIPLHWINSVIGFAFGIFVIINHYHLKLDLTQMFFSFVGV